jgi:hypothetical protein
MNCGISTLELLVFGLRKREESRDAVAMSGSQRMLLSPSVSLIWFFPGGIDEGCFLALISKSRKWQNG